MTLRLRAVTVVSLTVFATCMTLGAASVPPTPPTGRAVSERVYGAGRAVPPALLPNARALPANQLYIVHDPAGHRVLRYESGLANVGAGPLEIRSNSLRRCPPGKRHASQIIFRDRDRNGHFARKHDTRTTRHSAGCMVYHPTHSHWHFQAAARFAVYKPTNRQPVVVVGRKMSFCLRDSERVPDRWPTPDYAEYYGDCSRSAPQGISIGWADVYQNFLPGQSMRLPDSLRNGPHCLRTTVDPFNQLRETDDTDNTSVRAFWLRGSRVSTLPTRRCA